MKAFTTNISGYIEGYYGRLLNWSERNQIIRKLNVKEAGNIEMEIPLKISKKKNKNDLIFFILLFTYVFIFYFTKKNYGK